ncbi:hypothetical protein Ancab_010946 [Ancistrocladus abbreviatus]
MERRSVKCAILLFLLLCAWSFEHKHAAARGFVGDERLESHSQEIDDETVEYLQRNCKQELIEINRAVAGFDLSFPSKESEYDKESSAVHSRRQRFYATLGILPPHLRRSLMDCFSKMGDSFQAIGGIDSFLELIWGQLNVPRSYSAEKILKLRAASTNPALSPNAVPSPPASSSSFSFSSSSPSSSSISESSTNSPAPTYILPSHSPSRSLQERAESTPSPSKQKKTVPPSPPDKKKKIASSPPPVKGKKAPSPPPGKGNKSAPSPPPVKSKKPVSLDSKASQSKEHQKSQDHLYVIGGAVAGSVALIMMVLLVCLLRNNKAKSGDGQRDERPLLTLSQGSSLISNAKDHGNPTAISNSSIKPNAHDAVLPGIPEAFSDASSNSDQLPQPKTPATAAPPPPPPAPKAPPPPPPKAGPRAPPPPMKGARPPPMPPKSAANRRGQSSSGEGSELTGDSDAARTKLKPFFWDKVLANPEHSMVWDEIRAGSFQFNEEMIESLFGYSADDKKKNDRRSRSSSDPSMSYIKIIDPKKSQNLSILLRALNVTTEEVRDALLEGNELPTELLQTLLRMAPTQEEELKLRLFNGDLSQLGPAERFLKVIVDIPFAFKRMESLMFMMNMKEEVSGIKESFATLEVACDELKKSRLFLKLLEAVLKTGNRMNDGTYRGGAQAFKLDTLLKLSDVKGADGKTTLLHFVVQEICRTEGIRAHRAARENCSMSAVSLKADDFIEDPNNEATENHCALGHHVVSGLSSELVNVKKAAIIDADALTTTVSKLGQSLLKSKNFLTKEMLGMEEERFYHVLTDFVEDSEGEITRLLEEEKRISELVKSTADYFHGSSGREEGLRLFVIVRDFLLLLDKICSQLKAQATKPAGPSRTSSREKVTTPRAQEAQPQAVADMRRKLFPAIAERRVDDSSSDDETST